MTQTELESQIDRAVRGFCEIDGVDEDLANRLVGEGYLSYDDLEVIEPSNLMEMGELSEEDVDKIVEQAEVRALGGREAFSRRERRSAKNKKSSAKPLKRLKRKRRLRPKRLRNWPLKAEEEAEAEAKAGEVSAKATTATEKSDANRWCGGFK